MSLPLKVRVDIRDLWDSPNCSVKESVSSLSKILGHTVTPRVDWPILWAELKEQFSDNSTFVPLVGIGPNESVVRYTIAWYERLMGRLENERYADWTEQLLNVITDKGNRQTLSLQIEPTARTTGTQWNVKLGTFELSIPKTEPVSQSQLDSIYEKCFENLFDPNAKDAGWDDLAVEAPVAATPGVIPSSNERPFVARLPVLDALPRPPELFKMTGPYIMVVEERVPHILVQCSHEPSLELLAAYINKWGKNNLNDSEKVAIVKSSSQRNILTAKLIESEYFYGVIDTLSIERNMTRREPLNPTPVLAFIEGVLGYKLTNTNGTCRTYTTTTLLK
ncbi:hypothetical protein B0H19DRAFT_1061144 [Mycena capillaripes]|nr:hypothetical protein B0H19DRAFT_1061144 [Mycena capillaripes]